MKITTIMAVLAVSLAFATTGCKYNKAAKGGDAADQATPLADDGSTKPSDISVDDTEIVDSQAQSGSLSEVTDGGRFEDIYAKCTDVAFEPVYFGFDSTVVPQGELSKIDAVAQHLADKTDRVVVIEGNCDERGSNEYNLSLGENRAIILRNYLVNGGVSANRIQTRSYGEEKPAVDGHDESAWAKNRRGEFVIFQAK